MFRFSIASSASLVFCMTALGQHHGAPTMLPVVRYAPVEFAAPARPTMMARPDAGFGMYPGNWALRGSPRRFNAVRRPGAYGGFGGFALVSGAYDDVQEPMPTSLPVDDFFPYDDFFFQPTAPPVNLSGLPPLPNEHPNTARFQLQAPAGAEVWVQGKKIDDVGSTARTFESPPLKADETYSFDVRVVWTENGKKIEEKQTFKVRPGESEGLKLFASPATNEPVLLPVPKKT